MFSSSISSISAYLEEVVRLQERFDNGDLWFRGESSKHKDTRLIPKAYRSQRTTEDLLQLEFDLWSDFIRCGPQLTPVVPVEEFEWYFLMQHHGVPTRLLDWSDGSLIALHFAVCNRTDESDRLVYVVNPAWLDEQLQQPPNDDDAADALFDSYLPMDENRRRRIPLPEKPITLNSPHFIRRIAAQRSRFILLGKAPRWLSTQLGGKDGGLAAIRIDGKSIADMRRDLKTCGITQSVIFPDLDGLGGELKANWEEQTEPSRAG